MTERYLDFDPVHRALAETFQHASSRWLTGAQANPRMRGPLDTAGLRRIAMSDDNNPPRRRRGPIWLIFFPPGALILWWQYDFPKSGRSGPAPDARTTTNATPLSLAFWAAVALLLLIFIASGSSGR